MNAPSIKNEFSFELFSNYCKNNKLFKNLDHEERKYLYKISSLIVKKPGDIIFLSSAIEKDFYIVAAGKLELSLNSGKEKFYSKGDLFGEISVINGSPRMGKMVVTSNCKLIKFNGNNLTDERIIPAKIQLKIFKELADYVVSYLDNEYDFATEKVIRKGEGTSIEFKESTSKECKNAIIETICAFLNTNGGTILIGVKDNSEVVGVKDKNNKNANMTNKAIDSFINSVSQIIRRKVGATAASNIRYNIEDYNGKRLIRINCLPARQPAILSPGKGKDQIFFIRSGAETVRIRTIRQILEYNKKRFMLK